MAVGREGSVYYRFANSITRIRPTGQEVALFTDPSGVINGSSMAVADSDSILIACSSCSRVYTLRNGTLKPFLGTGVSGLPTEGAIATSTPITAPYGVALGPDGCVYVSDAGAHAIWRVAPDGRVYRYAGTPGTGSFSGDGGLAASATLNAPRHMVFGPVSSRGPGGTLRPITQLIVHPAAQIVYSRSELSGEPGAVQRGGHVPIGPGLLPRP